INAMSLLYCRTCSIGVCANATGLPNATVRIFATSGIVRTSPARSISRRFKAAASVNARAPNQPMASTAIICSLGSGPRADASLLRVLYAEDAPRAGQRTAQRRLVIEIALDDVDAVARQRRRLRAFRLARQAAQMEPFVLQRLRDRAPLMACHSGDENRFHG